MGLNQQDQVFIFPISYEDDYADLGNAPRRHITARLGVVGAVYGNPSVGTSDAENKLNYLMRNITRIFRVDHRLNSQTTFDLSSTVIGLRQEVDFEFQMPDGGEASYALAAMNRLTIELLST